MERSRIARVEILRGGHVYGKFVHIKNYQNLYTLVRIPNYQNLYTRVCIPNCHNLYIRVRIPNYQNLYTRVLIPNSLVFDNICILVFVF